MSFRDVVPAKLAEFLLSNKGGCEDLVLDSASHELFHSWTASELDAVVDAAKQNTSVRALSIYATYLHRNAADAEVMSSFVRHLRGLQSVDIQAWNHSMDDGNPIPGEAIDTLLRGIMKSEANIKHLSLLVRVSPGLFLKFAERFPNLESLALEGPCSSASDGCGRQCSDFRNFATEVAIAVSRILRSLRSVSVEFCGEISPMTDLLSYLGGAAPTSLKELKIVVSNGTKDDKGVSEAAARFCALTKTLEILKVHRVQDGVDPELPDLLSVGHMFQFWSRHLLSDSIREMHFDHCKMCDSDVPVEALKNVEVLRLNNSIFEPALSLLKNLPRLRSFHFTFEEARHNLWEVECRRGLLKDNSKLEALCETIERRDSMLRDIEIDLFGSYDANADDDDDDNQYYPFERFAASERLLRACKGRLVVNFASLPMYSCFDIVDGLESLRGDLKELRLRFDDCQFGETHYGRILEAIRRNRTLAVFEFGLSTRYSGKTISTIGDLVATNRALDTLSLLGMSSNAAVRLLDHVLPILSTTPNMTLRILQLDGADLTDAWPRLQLPLLSMLHENPVLSHLDGVVIPWNDTAAVEVRHLLKLNRYGRRFLPPHEMPRPTEGLWATILARIAKDKAHEVMYPFLRAKPSLLESRKRKHS